MNNKPIGIYDSGIGAIAVMRTIQNLLPNEKYIVLADFKNAPYGERSQKDISLLAKESVEYLVNKDVKAIVVACNTATSAAIGDLRKEFNVPIIGMEPAIKPAAESDSGNMTIVLATSATLKLMKFQKLFESLNDERIYPVACPGLSSLIENERQGSPKIKDYLKDILSEYNNKKISNVVIGCTHYSFIEKEIKKVTNCDNLFDGRHGTARYLKKTLEKRRLLSQGKGRVEFILDDLKDNQHELLKEFSTRPLSYKE